MKHWHVICCTGSMEARAVEKLDALGYPGGWFPVQEVRLSPRQIKRKLDFLRARGRLTDRPALTISRPWVSGYVFLPHDEIAAHRITGHYGAMFLAPLVIDAKCVTVTEDEIAGMQDIPARMQEARAEAEARARAAWEAKRPVVGQPATITADGPFCGLSGTVTDKTLDGWRVDVGGVLGKVAVREMELERA